jgi:hypothetical protein
MIDDMLGDMKRPSILPWHCLDPNPTNTMAVRAYSTKNTWYIEYGVIGPTEQKKQYKGEEIQMPAVCATPKSSNH